MERPELNIVNAAEAVSFDAGGSRVAEPATEPLEGQPDGGEPQPDLDEPAAPDAPAEPAKPEARKEPSGLDKLRQQLGVLYGKGQEAGEEPAAEPEPKTAEGRIKQLVEHNRRLEKQIEALSARIDGPRSPAAGVKPDLSVVATRDLVRGLKLEGMDPESAAEFKESLGPAVAEIAEALYAQHIEPLKQTLAKQNERLATLDVQDYERELSGYLGDAWDKPTQELVRTILDREGASEFLNNPRIAAVWIMGLRSVVGMDALEAAKTGAEKDLTRKMAGAGLAPSKAGSGGSDAPNRILLGEDYQAHKRQHGREAMSR